MLGYVLLVPLLLAVQVYLRNRVVSHYCTMVPLVEAQSYKVDRSTKWSTEVLVCVSWLDCCRAYAFGMAVVVRTSVTFR